MNVTQSTRLVREGDLVAEVHIELLEGDGGWSPYLSLDDANKLDDVRDALRRGDLQRASRLSDRIFRLMPLAATDR
jgi:hypothetical protein